MAGVAPEAAAQNQVTVSLEAVDLVMAEGDATDTAQLRIRFSRRLAAGEKARFDLNRTNSPDVTHPSVPNPDYGISISGAGVSAVVRLADNTPILDFIGSGAVTKTMCVNVGIPPEEFLSDRITIRVFGDRWRENDEDIRLHLLPGRGWTDYMALGNDGLTFTIVNNVLDTGAGEPNTAHFLSQKTAAPKNAGRSSFRTQRVPENASCVANCDPRDPNDARFEQTVVNVWVKFRDRVHAPATLRFRIGSTATLGAPGDGPNSGSDYWIHTSGNPSTPDEHKTAHISVSGDIGTVVLPDDIFDFKIGITLVDDRVNDSGETIILTLLDSDDLIASRDVYNEHIHKLTIYNDDPDTPESRAADDDDPPPAVLAPIAQCTSDLPANAVSVSEMEDWRDDPRYRSDPTHVARWNRALAALDPAAGSGTPMTALEAQTVTIAAGSTTVTVATTPGEAATATVADNDILAELTTSIQDVEGGLWLALYRQPARRHRPEPGHPLLQPRLALDAGNDAVGPRPQSPGHPLGTGRHPAGAYDQTGSLNPVVSVGI